MSKKSQKAIEARQRDRTPDLDELLRDIMREHYRLQEIGHDEGEQFKQHQQVLTKDYRLTCDYCGGAHDEGECSRGKQLIAAINNRRNPPPSTPADWEAEADQIVTLASTKVSEQGARRLRAELALAKSEVATGHLTGQDALLRIMASSEDVIAKSPK